MPPPPSIFMKLWWTLILFHTFSLIGKQTQRGAQTLRRKAYLSWHINFDIQLLTLNFWKIPFLSSTIITPIFTCCLEICHHFTKLSSSWQVQCQFNWELRLVLNHSETHCTHPPHQGKHIRSSKLTIYNWKISPILAWAEL